MGPCLTQIAFSIYSSIFLPNFKSFYPSLISFSTYSSISPAISFSYRFSNKIINLSIHSSVNAFIHQSVDSFIFNLPILTSTLTSIHPFIHSSIKQITRRSIHRRINLSFPAYPPSISPFACLSFLPSFHLFLFCFYLSFLFYFFPVCFVFVLIFFL